MFQRQLTGILLPLGVPGSRATIGPRVTLGSRVTRVSVIWRQGGLESKRISLIEFFSIQTFCSSFDKE